GPAASSTRAARSCCMAATASGGSREPPHKPGHEINAAFKRTRPVHEGFAIKCHVVGCAHVGSRFFPAEEEKRTDVNIGVHMLDDAYPDVYDRLVLVSGDSDLVPAVHMVKGCNPPERSIVSVPARSPVRGAAVELRSAADKNRLLPLQLLPKAQFAAQVPDGTGGFLTKPPSW